MRVATVDIETPLIPPAGVMALNKIYCIGVKINDGPTHQFTYIYHPSSSGNLRGALNLINSCDICIGHNFVKFDAPVINQLVGLITIPILDTLILSKMMYTQDQLVANDAQDENHPKNLYGSYSLKAFGHRFGNHKIHFEQFDRLTDEMLVYCTQDVELTYQLYIHLRNNPNYPPDRAIRLEHDVAAITFDQEQFGFYFDIDSARKMYTKFLFERGNLDRKLQKQFRPMFLPDGPIQTTNKQIRRRMYEPTTQHVDSWFTSTGNFNFKPYRKPLKKFKSGKLRLPAKTKYKWFDRPHHLGYSVKNGEYQNIKLTRFEATDNQIKTWLDRMYGFQFDSFTKTGNIKVERDELAKLGTYGEDLTTLIKLKKDISQLGGTDNSLISQYRPETHSIHGRIDTLGAATHRCTHSSPNLAQIPADHDWRALFTAPPGHHLVGADLANIEIRVLAHYLAEYDSGKYAQAVLSKDMHWYHAKLAGFWDKDDRDWPTDAEDHLRTPEMKAARAKSKGFFFG